MEKQLNELNIMELVEKKRSERISLEDAKKMTQDLRKENVADFALPLAWTFDACDLREVLLDETANGPVRVKIYGGLAFNTDYNKNILTLIIAGVKSDDSDIYLKGGKSIMFEYADPCPPKCGAVSTELLPSGECIEILVKQTETSPAACEPFGHVSCEPVLEALKTIQS